MSGLSETSLPEIVFFDVGDTLMRAHPSWAELYAGVLRAHGIDVELASLEQAMVQATKSVPWSEEGPFEASAEASFARVTRFDEAVVAALGIDGLPERFFRDLGAAFARTASWHVFPDTLPVLDALTSAGIRRAVISNWVWEGPELLHALELAERFERLTISSRVGYAKPHAQIFRRALEDAGVPPDRAVHVGDSYSADVIGARAAGIEPVLIRRDHTDAAREQTDLPEGEAVVLVRDLVELLDHLGLPTPGRPARPAVATRGP